MTLLPPLPLPVIALATPPPRPRVWPAYVSTAALFTAVIGAQLLMVAIVAIALLVQGERNEKLSHDLLDLATQPAYLAIVVMLNICLELVAALLPAALSRTPLPQRLRLARPQLPLIVLALGACGATAYAFSFDCFSQLSTLHSQALEHFSDSIAAPSPATAVILFAVVIGAPIAEELFFRGYLQTRLAARHGPVLGILITAFFFGLLHMDPVQSPFAFGFGICLGIIAYRSGSIYPTIAAHMLNNAAAIVVSGLVPLPENPILLALLTLFFAALAALLLLPVLLIRRRP